MKLTIESTPELMKANGIPVRVWTGTTERGTPILALVTRVAVPDTASPEQIADFERELSEPPTRVVDPSGATIAAPRTCTVCNARGQTGKRASFIASNAVGLQWFECEDHGPGDHAATFGAEGVADGQRVSRESLESWFHRHELPVPGADPDAYALEVVESPDGSERRVTNRCRWPLVVVRVGAEATPEPHEPGSSAVLRPGDYIAVAVEQPTTQLSALGYALARMGVGNPSLVDATEDDWRRFAEGARDELRARVLVSARAWVESWEANDAVPDPDELPAERALYDSVLALRAAEIDAKIDAEHDNDEPTLTTAPAVLDGGMRVDRNDGEIGDVVYQTLATASPPLPIETFRASIEALASQLADIPEAAHHYCQPSPRLAGAVVRALLAHPHVAEAKDAATAGEFLSFALRGAQLGWHVRHAHPGDVHHVAVVGAPVHEPHRSAWLDGYRIGAETIVAPIHLTDALRSFHDTHLIYRAPEQLTAREREIISAVEAERAAAVGDPETLAAHAFGGQGGAGS